MGDSSDGTPSGPSGLHDVKDLLQRTKNQYILIHPNDKRWPCPFCLYKGKTLFQCKLHIRTDHPNLGQDLTQYDALNPTNSNINNLLSQNADFSTNNSINKKNQTSDDLSHNNDNMNKVPFDTNSMQFEDMLNGDDDDYFYCPHCEERKGFLSIRNVNIHIGKKHKGKKKMKIEDLEVGDYEFNAIDPTDFGHRLAFHRKSIPTLRRCPKGARQDLANCLTNVINLCIRTNDEHSWNQLLLFPYAVLKIPDESENVNNLTSYVRQNVSLWHEVGTRSIPNLPTNEINTDNIGAKTNTIFKKVEAKLSDGDVSGSLRLLSSDDIIAPNNEITLNALKEKHPTHPEPSNFPNSSIEIEQITPTEEEVNRSIVSFRKGIAGGLDSLRPQILKDLLYVQNGDTGSRFLKAVTSLTTIILKGDVPLSVSPYFYGASLTALQKKCGGIRPIAVGNSWRRISAKIACRKVASVLSNLFLPNQLGVGIKNGAEAGAHAARIYYTSKHSSIRVFIKIDIRNAFNELRRDVLLDKVKSTIPEIFNFVEHCYGAPTNLYYREHVILSQRGVQQGDPLGPALFCLVLQDIISSLKELDLNIWYLDDVTIAGTPDNVSRALQEIIHKTNEIGLQLNRAKCEMSVLGTPSTKIKSDLHKHFDSLAKGIQMMKPENEFLLGSPLTEAASKICLAKKTTDLRNLAEKMKNISMHSTAHIIFSAYQ